MLSFKNNNNNFKYKLNWIFMKLYTKFKKLVKNIRFFEIKNLKFQKYFLYSFLFFED